MRILQPLFIGLCIFAFSLGPGVSVFAQTGNEPTGYKQVNLWIKPEYDDQRLLVMLEGQIVGVKAPAQVKFLVPTAAEMYSAGSKDAQGKYSGGPPARQPSAIQGWDEISYEVTSETFRVEYYDPSIVGYPDKKISYEFRTIHPITSVHIDIQQPFSSGDFLVSPPGQVDVDFEGFTEHGYKYPTLEAGGVLAFEISYTKSDARPSLTIAANRTSSPLPLIIIAVTLAVVLVAVILIRRRKFLLKKKRRQLPRSKSGNKKKENKTAGGFCRECGKEIEGPFLFCPFCGAKRDGKTASKSV